VSEFWWGLLWLSLFIPLMFLWGFALWDIFNRHDLSGLSKALWAVAIVFLPLFGLFIYFIARPKDLDAGRSGVYGSPYSMADGRQYQRASGPSPASADMDTITRLHDSGTLSDDEFNDLKARMAG
jgi:hypothetical protein